MRDLSPRSRFSGRAENYIRYRPSYPPELVEYILEETGFPKGVQAADIGSGTGKFSRLLLQKGFKVYGVEPNYDMREAAQRLLHFPGFTSQEGAAEDTGLPDSSVDLITVAQAFHWFDVSGAKDEFKRILRSGGFCAILWNKRLLEESPFLQAYEQLLRTLLPGYARSHHTAFDESILDEFYEPFGYEKVTFENVQQLDFDGLRGRLMSASYAPDPDDEESYKPIMKRLRKIFDRLESNGKVNIEYDTTLYIGCLG